MPLLAELEFPHFLDKQVWVAETDKSWCAWVDLPHVAIVLFHPHIFVVGIRIFLTPLLLLGTRVDCCVCVNFS